MLINLLQCTGQPPQWRTIQPPKWKMLRLRLPGIKGQHKTGSSLQVEKNSISRRPSLAPQVGVNLRDRERSKSMATGKPSTRCIPSPRLIPPKMVPKFCFHHDSSTEKRALAEEYVSILLGQQRSHFLLINCILAYMLC